MEVLISIGVISLAMVGVFAGLSTTVKVSGLNSRQVSVNNVLTSVAESLQAMPYQRCRDAAAMTADYAAWTGGFHPTGFDVRITAVEYGNPNWNGASEPAFVASCPTGNAPKKLVVQVSPAGDPGTLARGEVVVRDPTARPS